MTLEKSIAKYSSVKSAYEKDLAYHTDLITNRLPKENNELSKAEMQIENAQAALKKAQTTAEVKAKRDKLKSIKELVEDQAQLVANLETQAKKWNLTAAQRERDLRAAEREMWQLKKAALLAELVIPPEFEALLEKIVAANSGATGGSASTRYGGVLDEVLSAVEGERVLACRASLLDSMGIK